PDPAEESEGRESGQGGGPPAGNQHGAHGHAGTGTGWISRASSHSLGRPGSLWFRSRVQRSISPGYLDDGPQRFEAGGANARGEGSSKALRQPRRGSRRLAKYQRTGLTPRLTPYTSPPRTLFLQQATRKALKVRHQSRGNWKGSVLYVGTMAEW